MRKPNFELLLPSFEKDYVFELCPSSKIDAVVQFIDQYWKKDHIFVRSREMLDWQFYNPQTDQYNIVIACHKGTGEIHAMVAFVSTDHFDPQIQTPVRWGNIWKSAPQAQQGLGMMVEWKKNLVSRAMAEVGVGISQTAVRLAKKTGASVGVMDHFFLVNPCCHQFKIAQNKADTDWNSLAVANPRIRFQDCGLEDFHQLEGMVLRSIPPYKSKQYYENRFFHHPIYQYFATKIVGPEQQIQGVFFWRICSANGSHCLRIVDYFGQDNALAGCRSAFEKLLRQHDAEYIDILSVGMPHDELLNAGFLNRRSCEDWIIPNFFEPFVPENVDIAYSSMPYVEEYDCRIFKGDSDQDRPNQLPV